MNQSSSLWQLLGSISDAFGKASSLANAVTILVPLLGWIASVRWIVHRKLRSKEGQIHDLIADRERRDRELGIVRATLKNVQDCCSAFERRRPEAVLDEARRELGEGNNESANRALVRWCQTEGAMISQLLLKRAEWAISHAVSDGHAYGLVAAEAHTIAAMSIFPENHNAQILLRDITAKMMDEVEIEAWPPYQKALRAFEERSFESFNGDLAAEANTTETEAYRELICGRYNLALPLAERTIQLRIKTVGKGALQTFRARNLEAQVLEALGRYEEALLIVQAVTAAQEASPAFGPAHPYTLESRHLKTLILDRLGRYEEALPIVQTVVALREASPALGPAHPDTLRSRHLEAAILDHLGRYEEALPIIQMVAGAEEAHPALGPAHPYTLRSRRVEAAILSDLGRFEEALPIIQMVAAAEGNSPLGPTHPDTLGSRRLEAQILSQLGRYEEALPIVRAVAAGAEASPALGPAHPGALASRYLEAQILSHLGRFGEALPIIQMVAGVEEAHPALGPAHPDALASRCLEAQILERLGKYEEALPIVQAVAVAQEASPALGSAHPDALNSRRVEAQILDKLRRYEEALPIIRTVVAEKEASPANQRGV